MLKSLLQKINPFRHLTLLFLFISPFFLFVLTKKLENPQTLDSQASTIPASELSRFGVGVHSHTPADYLHWYNYQPLNLGWYFTWTYRYNVDYLPGDGPQFFPMIYSSVCSDTFVNYVSANPDLFPPDTTFFVGNEIYEPGTKADTTQNYAVAYHDCYHAIKTINPSYQVAIAAMRSAGNTAFYDDLRYHYHRAYGVNPPIDVYRVNIYSANLTFFDGQVRQVRQKMKEWGDQDKALIVTESCGRGSSSSANAQYIPQILDYLTGSASVDQSLGQASDGYKMVQKFGWYSLNADRIYPECALFNPSQHSAPAPPPTRSELTQAGTALVNWMADHVSHPTSVPTTIPTSIPTSTLTPTSIPTLTPTNIPPSPTPTPTSVPSMVPTATSTLVPTLTSTPQPSLTCQSLQFSGSATLGQTIDLVCQSNISAHHFDFRILFADGSTTDIGSVLAQTNLATLSHTISHTGCYDFQCRSCATANSSSCTSWDEL